jgi:hypothetical protein
MNESHAPRSAQPQKRIIRDQAFAVSTALADAKRNAKGLAYAICWPDKHWSLTRRRPVVWSNFMIVIECRGDGEAVQITRAGAAPPAAS